MPTYEYKCTENNEHRYSEVRGINDEATRETCVIEGCDGKLARVFSAPPISFKGSGFSTKSPFV